MAAFAAGAHDRRLDGRAASANTLPTVFDDERISVGFTGKPRIMPPTRYPDPICQTKDWYREIDDGTLVRWRSEPPSVIGMHGSGAPTNRLPPNARASSSAGHASSSSPNVNTVQAPALATGACSFLNPRTTDTVVAPQEAFDRLRRDSGPAKISPPQPTASQAWPHGGASAAVAQGITIDGKAIGVIRPTDADAAGKNLPSTAQLAEALRAIPASQRAHTTKVILSPRPHPESKPLATIAGEAGRGEITLFPVNKSQSQNDFDNRVMHESGHNYQGTLWNSGAAVGEWQTAATADHSLPSQYAGFNPGDDFCEFGVLYNTARGTPCEASARKLYPNRWVKMVEYQSR